MATHEQEQSILEVLSILKVKVSYALPSVQDVNLESISHWSSCVSSASLCGLQVSTTWLLTLSA